MMFQWFKIFNRTAFTALGLTSRTLTLELAGVGVKDILVTKGILFGMTYEGVFLPAELNDKNPFVFEGLAVYVDDNDDVFLGIEVDES